MEMWNAFLSQLLETTAIEFLAVVTGIASVWFSKQEKILVYPFGIISVGLYIFITYQYKLYADTGINAYYLLMSLYGWYNWKNTKIGADQIPITSSTKKGNIFNVSIMLAAFFLLWILLSQNTDSDVPMWDALTTSFAITAMYLMAQKKIEHWYFWIGTNISSIPLYIYKELPFTSFQFIVFGYIAVLGLISWRQKMLIGDHETDVNIRPTTDDLN
ncbi:MAG: nicotinamide riboside transporter PnuC [Cyclobacteriaceae bacterium]